MLIAQITDCHVVAPSRRVRGEWDTGADLRAAIGALLAHDPRPDLALVTGDLVDDGAEDSYVEAAEALAPLMATVPVLFIPGNHDDRDRLRCHFPAVPWAEDCEPFAQFDAHHGDLRLIGLDTLVPGQTAGALCEARLDWLDRRLDKAPETPTLIALHHPPFTAHVPFMDGYGLSGRDALADRLARHDQVVRLVSGHLHRQVTTTVAGIPATVCPSPSLQVPLKLTEGFPPATAVDEPRCVHLHLWRHGTLTTHTLYTPRGEAR